MKHLPSPSDAEATYAKAVRLEATIGRLDEAEELYRAFCAMAPEDARGPNKLGVCKALRGQFDDAEVQFRRALALNPKFPPALTNLGNVLLERQDVEGAMALYEQALAEDPDYSAAHNNLAAALKKRGDLHSAVQHLRQAHRSTRKRDREKLRDDVQRGCFSRGATVLVLASVGLLSLGVFWR